MGLVSRIPFVGRVGSWRVATARLDATAAGRGGLLLIDGEAGLGKTTLADELGRTASERGFRVAVGGARHGDEAPFAPFVELIEQLYHSLPIAEFVDVLGPGAGDIARFVPELRRWFPTTPAPVAVPPGHERRLVFSAVTEALRRLGTVAPALLVLEDLHWADTATLLLISHLAPRLAGTPTLVVATFRPEDDGMPTPLEEAVEQWRRHGLSEHIALRALDRSEVGEMLAALGGRPPPERVVARCHELTGGNPFFVAEVFRHLSARDATGDSQGVWLELGADADLPVPPAVRRITAMRVRDLSPVAQEVLDTVAVAGHASMEILSEALATTPDVLVRAVDEASRADLLVATAGPGVTEHHFGHELMRLAVLAGMTPLRRQRLHASVAAAIESTDGDRLGVRAAELVHHLCRAGNDADPGRLLTHLDAAAAHAERAAAFEDALAHLEIALGLVGPRRDAAWIQLLERRARVLCGLGRWDEAQDAWHQAIHVLGAAEERAAIGTLCTEAAGNLFWSGRYDECQTAVRTGLAALAGQEGADRVRLLALGGKCATFAGDHDTGERLTAEALVVAQEIGGDAARAAASFARTVHLWSVVEPADAVRHGRRAAVAARASGALWELADGLGFVQFAHVLAGELDAVAAIDTELGALVERLGHYGGAFMRGRAAVLSQITRGDVDAIDAAARADLERCHALGLPWTADSRAWLGLAAFWRGDWSRADEHYRQGMSEDPAGILAGACWAMTFLLRAHQHDDRGCRRLLRDAADRFPISGRPASLGSWTSLLATVEGLVIRGHHEHAARHYPAVLRTLAAGNVLRGYDNRLVETVAALAAHAAGDAARADEHFRRAHRQAATIRHRIERPETCRLHAWVLLERGDPADRAVAAELLEDAVAAYHTLGMGRHEELARDLLLRATSSPGIAGGLTARERDVLVEVAAGRTSKEIARELSISIATVNRHTANVYAKIDVRNRTEATRWALHHGLLRTGAEPPAGSRSHPARPRPRPTQS
ncbi:helix-turn-helix transcriptional regulator [Actinomycetospora sp. C-140]